MYITISHNNLLKDNNESLFECYNPKEENLSYMLGQLRNFKFET